MEHRYKAVLLSVLVASCSSEESKPNVNSLVTAPSPTTVPALDAATAKMAVASIASVQMAKDCPDPKTSPSAELKSMDEPEPVMKGASSSKPVGSTSARLAKGASPFGQPCAQSTVQIAFTGKGTASAAVKIGAVRLKSAEGKELATLAARQPSLWKETGYESWDGVLGADSDHKASYKLSVPEWSELERTLGRGSYGQMFLLEIEIDIGGVVSTITSPQFERAQDLMIQT